MSGSFSKRKPVSDKNADTGFACLYYAETMLFQRVLTSGMMYIHTFSLIRLLFLL